MLIANLWSKLFGITVILQLYWGIIILFCVFLLEVLRYALCTS